MIFNIDISDFVQKLIKKEFRKPRFLKLFFAKLKPFKDINDSFVSVSDAITYKLKFNAQTIYLEHYLNDQYDATLRRIWIENLNNTNNLYIFNEAEGEDPEYIFNEAEPEYMDADQVYIFNQGEPLVGFDYIVWVPIDVIYDETVMRAQIDQYNYLGKKYQIQTF